VRASGRLFYLRSAPGDAVFVLCERDAGGGAERVLVDLARGLRRGDDPPAVGSFLPSPDGRYVAYAISRGATDAELHVLDVETGTDLPERVSRTYGPGATAWRDDSRSFFYDRYPPLAAAHDPRDERRRAVAYLHVIGRTPDQDTPVFGIGVDRAIPFVSDDLPIVRLSRGSPYAVGLIHRGSSSELGVYVAPVRGLSGSRAPWHEVAGSADGVTAAVAGVSTLFLLDHRGAPDSELRAVPLAAPDFAKAATLAANGPEVLEEIAAARDALYVRARRGATGRVLRLALGSDGASRETLQTVPLPGAASALGLTTEPGVDGAVVQTGSWPAGARGRRHRRPAGRRPGARADAATRARELRRRGAERDGE